MDTIGIDVYYCIGFATYYSHYGINHTNPELNPWEQFVPRVLQVAMEFDSSNGIEQSFSCRHE